MRLWLAAASARRAEYKGNCPYCAESERSSRVLKFIPDWPEIDEADVPEISRDRRLFVRRARPPLIVPIHSFSKTVVDALDKKIQFDEAQKLI
jgi:hypothetical protein